MSNLGNQDSGTKENANPAGFLDWWLHAATKDLATGAQARIRSEIESHYAESVHSHLAEGMSEPDAQTAAFAELGEPAIAAKRFRKHHLTAREESQLQKLEKHAAKHFTALELFGWILAGGLIVFLFTSIDSPVVPIVAVGLGIFVSGFFPRLFFHLLPARSRIQWLLLFEIAADVIFGVGFFLIINGSALHLFSWYYGVALTLPYLRWVLLWHRLRKVGDVLGKAPPQSPAS